LGCFTLLTGIYIVQTTASESGLFDHLINVWEFKPGPVPGTCDLYFLVDFKFQSPLHRQVSLLQYCASNNLSYGPLQSESFSCQVASMFFKEVVSRLVSSLNDRCFRIYGPPVPVLENT
jgi:coenzyme Q-binding protein COQ10